jgi:alkanesulfonate monooxygenase SsuD/methylene tetrahydromethanopterin reductase-like flavin-dependent oxidoreductase (luciferase family)
MSPRNALRFGVSIDPSAAGFEANLELARVAEETGLDLLTAQDHPYHARHLDAFTHLAFLGARTESVRLITNVANLPLRGPQMIAKAAGAISIGTGARFELGIGAGAMWDAIEAYGGPRREPGEAVDALEEAIEVVRLLWDPAGGGGYDGEYYRLAGARPGPPPPGDIPVIVGAYGPRMLALTGRVADGWVPSLQFAGPDRIPEMQERIDVAAFEAGRDPGEVLRIYNVPGLIADRATGGEERRIQRDASGWVDVLSTFIGDLGFDTIVYWPPTDVLVEQTRRFAEEVVPEVRTEAV